MNNIQLLTKKLNAHGIAFSTEARLSDHSTFRIGGMATLMVFPKSTYEIIDTICAARETETDFITVGNGSNILFSDSGYGGLVILTGKCNDFSVEGSIITADCGASFTRLATVAKDSSLSGLEFAYGIPGTVGGAVHMNAGAYGGEVSDCLVSVKVYDDRTDTVSEYSKNDCEFGYRTSIFAKSQHLTVLSARFELNLGDKNAIQEKMSENMKSRREKQPLEFPNAGSTFKRPEGLFAAKLIDDAGLKGFRIGGAEVSSKHAGFVVNRENATSDDVLHLIDHIKKTVYEKFGVMLECEIKIIK